MLRCLEILPKNCSLVVNRAIISPRSGRLLPNVRSFQKTFSHLPKYKKESEETSLLKEILRAGPLGWSHPFYKPSVTCPCACLDHMGTLGHSMWCDGSCCPPLHPSWVSLGPLRADVKTGLDHIQGRALGRISGEGQRGQREHSDCKAGVTPVQGGRKDGKHSPEL